MQGHNLAAQAFKQAGHDIDKEIEEGWDKFTLAHYDARQLIKELWERQVTEDTIRATYYALDQIANENMKDVEEASDDL
jgi:hypothetical protein